MWLTVHWGSFATGIGAGIFITLSVILIRRRKRGDA